ncbi:dimethylargininase [Agrococcus sp. 1P02AA]|uniref:dimethylargininase n=1 Tax=Agrococcus sp. 1P02AA TaxID=3132259 RepID=UPI0039A6589F
MQHTTTSPALQGDRIAKHKTVLMCRPEHFTVSYAINPWMDPSKPTRTEVALAQWQTLHDAYVSLGYDVELIDPVTGLDDMVYAANGGFTLDGKAYGAKFTYAERMPEGPAYMAWFADNGFEVHEPEHVNEGEGDMLLSQGAILAGHGFRTSLESHDELRRAFDREVVSLRLVDPRFYHLDTAMAILDDQQIAYLPAAFDEASRAELERRYPDAIIVDEADASVLGLNSFGDGRTMVIAQRATGFERQLAERGYETIGLDLSELLLGGGGIKCCTLELRR